MTIRVNAWYRVKETGQYCRIQRIPSMTNPRVSVPKADENTRGFEVALEWYSPPAAAGGTWTRRVMILGLKKAFILLREPAPADAQAIEVVKSIAHTLPVAAASRDGEFTLPP
jgi:hypothetical protein